MQTTCSLSNNFHKQPDILFCLQILVSQLRFSYQTFPGHSLNENKSVPFSDNSETNQTFFCIIQLAFQIIFWIYHVFFV